MSKGLSLQKHVLIVFINNPGRQFTIEQLLQLPALAKRNPKSNTVSQALGRMWRLKLLDKIHLGGINVAFKLRDLDRSRQYIAGTLPPTLTPTLPDTIRPTSKRHRVTYLLKLSKSDLEVVEHLGKPHSRNGKIDLYHLKTENFNLTVYPSSGKAQVFIYKEPGWKGEFQHIFGTELTYMLSEQVYHKQGNSGLAHPITTIGERIYVDNALVRIGRSQFPLEIDVHGPEQNVQGEVVESLWQDIKFRALVLNGFSKLYEQDERFAKVLNDIYLNQATKADIHELTNALLKVAKVLEPLSKVVEKPSEEQNYQGKKPQKKDYDPSYS